MSTKRNKEVSFPADAVIRGLQARVQQLMDRCRELEELLGIMSNSGPRFTFFHLTPEEDHVLGMIFAQPKVCSRLALFLGCYGGRPECDQPDQKVIDVVVCHIRKKLKRYAATSNTPEVVISTMWGRGYYFDSENRARLQAIIDREPKDKIACPEGTMYPRPNRSAGFDSVDAVT